MDASGNIYVLGISANSNTNTGYVVVKYAPNGNQMWTARYDSTNYPSATPTGLALDSSNNVAVTGNAVTVKYDVNGKQLWIAPYNGTAIAMDAGQNSYVTGVSGKFTTMKMSPTGSNMWTTTWTYQGLPNLSEAVAVDLLTNVYVAGSELYTIGRGVNYANMGTLKYDMDGNQLWEKDALGTVAGGVNVVGIALDNTGNLFLEANFIGVTGKFQTYRYDNEGDGGLIASDRSYQAPSDEATGMALDSFGNVLVTGGWDYASPAYRRLRP